MIPDTFTSIPLGREPIILPMNLLPGECGVDYIFTGGAVICELLEQTGISFAVSPLKLVKDIDIFILNHESEYNIELAYFFGKCEKVDDIGSDGAANTDISAIRPPYLNGNVKHPDCDYKLDIITDRRYLEPSDVIQTFDLINSRLWFSGNIFDGQSIRMSYLAFDCWSAGVGGVKQIKATTLDRVKKYMEKYTDPMRLAMTKVHTLGSVKSILLEDFGNGR